MRLVLQYSTIPLIKRKHKITINSLFLNPISANIKWQDIESLFKSLGADISEGAGSRVRVKLFNSRRVFHRPHPTPNTDKGAVLSIRKWLEKNGVKP